MARILLTDGEQRSTLATTRSLGRAGHEVQVAAVAPHPLAGASRYCRRVIRVPDPGDDPAGYVEALREAVHDGVADMLIPMTDVAASLALPLRHDHPGLTIPFPDEEAYRSISDKAHLLSVAETLGVPVPGQTVLASPEDARALDPAALHFPVVLKPARSAVDAAHGVSKFGVRMIEDAAALARALPEHPPEAYPLLLQQRIEGPGLGAFALFWEGEPVAWFAHRRVREKPPTGGVSVYRESVPLRDDLREYSARILGHFGWSGVAMVEFKQDVATGTPYLMEVNGRLWGSLQLAIDSGVDFPALLAGLALGEPVRPPAAYRTGIRSRWLWGDADHTLAMLRRGRRLRRTHPELPGSLATMARFLVPWRPGDRFEVLRAGDPGPFLRETLNWFGSAVG